MKLREGLVKRDVAGGIGSPSCGRGVEMGGLENFEFGWVDGLGVSWYGFLISGYHLRGEIRGGFFCFFFLLLFIRMRFHVLVLLFVGHSGIWNGVA